jgi:hypothetical protein
MRCGVDLLQLADRDVRVDLRAVQVCVTEHLLYETDIGGRFPASMWPSSGGTSDRRSQWLNCGRRK